MAQPTSSTTPAPHQQAATPGVHTTQPPDEPVYDPLLLLRAYPDDTLDAAKKKAADAIAYNKKLSETIKANQQEPVEYPPAA